jgi:hypothetical protein
VRATKSPRSLRRVYLEWIEEQLEDFKDSIPRADLLSIADEVVHKLRVDSQGQYQLTEVLLTEAFDRHLVRLLKLPGYRSWRSAYLASAAPAEPAPGDPEPAEPPPPPAPATPVISVSSRAIVPRRPLATTYPLPVARVG